MYLLINFFAFQIGWFVCVLGAANSIPLLGPVIVAAVIAMHLSQSNKPVRELALTGVAGPLTFYGGAQLGGVVFLDQRAGLIALSVGWAVMMPTLIILAARLDGIAVPIVGEQARV